MSLNPLLSFYRQVRSRWKQKVWQFRYSRMSREQAFTDIYKKSVWGGEKGKFYSGRGSSYEGIVGPYIRAVRSFLETIPAEERTVVDLGCGDFNVGSQLIDICDVYHAVDIVPEVISDLRTRWRSEKLKFEQLDIVRDPLPEAKVCLIRQVFQHLSNADILAVLAKLKPYDEIIITEHYPAPERFKKANVDKIHGPGIRALNGSAVCLDRPPFSIPTAAMSLLVEVPADGQGRDLTQGYVRTFRLSGKDIPL